MQIALCEPCRRDRTHIETYLASKHIDTDTFDTGESLIRTYQKHSPSCYDALIIAIDLPGTSGLAVAQAIRSIDAQVPIIFTAAHTNALQESLKVSPLRLLVKPIQPGELAEAIRALLAKLEKDRQTYVFKDTKKIIRLYCDDIIYCESNGHYVTIYTTDSSYTIRQSINDIEQAVALNTFYRVHRSYLLNLKYLKLMQDNKITLQKSSAIIPIGRDYKKDLVKTIIQLHERKKC